MIWKITSIVCLAAFVVGGEPAISEQKVKINHEHVGHHRELSHIGSHKPEHHEEYAWAFPSYEFSYKVNDPHTHDMKGQHESRHGDEVKGEYWLVEPDGRKRTVKYHADKKTGFKAHVEYSAPHHHVEFKTHRHHDHKPVVEHHHEKIIKHIPVIEHNEEIEHKPIILHKQIVEHKPIILHKHVIDHKPMIVHKPMIKHVPIIEHKLVYEHKPVMEHKPEIEHHPILHKPKITEHIRIEHDNHKHWGNHYHHDRHDVHDHHDYHDHHEPRSRPLIRRLQENYHHPRYYRTPQE